MRASAATRDRPALAAAQSGAPITTGSTPTPCCDAELTMRSVAAKSNAPPCAGWATLQ